MSVAERYYLNHKKYVTAYQKRTPEKQQAKCKKYMDKLRAETPERYELMKEKARKYFHEVTKPKKLAALKALTAEIQILSLERIEI